MLLSIFGHDISMPDLEKFTSKIYLSPFNLEKFILKTPKCAKRSLKNVSENGVTKR